MIKKFLLSIFAIMFMSAGSSIVAESVSIDRGEYLAESIVACGNCHTPKNSNGQPILEKKYAGGFLIEEPPFIAYAPNITMDKETGIGHWSDEEIVRSIREGIRPDGTIIGPPMPTMHYKDMSDNDVKSIVAYMRSLKPINNLVPKSEYRMPLPPKWVEPVGRIDDIAPDDPAYPAYITSTLGHCDSCHTPRVEGKSQYHLIGLGGVPFVGIFGLNVAAVSSNITPHPDYGLGKWSDADIKKALTKGISPDGRVLAKVMGFSYYNRINEQDLDAMVRYMRELKPLP